MQQGNVMASDRERRAATMARLDHGRRNALYELLKEYRGVPDSKQGVCAGTLTPRETWLFDRLSDFFR